MTARRRLALASSAGSLVAFVLVVSACGDDESPAIVRVMEAGSEAATVDAAGDVAEAGPPSPPPPPPALGVQIDRMGRPLVTSALIGLLTPLGTAGAKKDAYNAARDPAGWPTAHGPELAVNLAVLDGVNGTCGDQLTPTTDAGDYAPLARMLADDRLWLDTTGNTGAQYLAMEYAAAGLIPNTDRGGRTLAYDVVDVTYSALATGAISGVGDDIGASPTKPRTATFPYLAAPE